MSKATLTFNLTANCKSVCNNCKYGLKPSECDPWDKAINEFRKNIPSAYELLEKIDKFYQLK